VFQQSVPVFCSLLTDGNSEIGSGRRQTTEAEQRKQRILVSGSAATDLKSNQNQS